ncbi:hypothetical protein CTAYLR_001210 [Chrysophaeum taylorii]|uniref:Kinesin motor domain-containing protein n=1 Tax=Chrysophaeum taylorii TaxID=2483200 RepID=A0AAD7XNN3_9STRA|nr:hypothetical protein CTAYLR_001210 [Chrysophaeum taylorii]
MASAASVRDVRSLRVSQSEDPLQKKNEEHGSIADKLYTKSERSLLEGDWDTMVAASPKRASRDDATNPTSLADSDLELAEVVEEGDEDMRQKASTGLLTMLRESLPYWGSQGMESLQEAVRKALGSLKLHEINASDPETGDTALLLCAQYGAGELVELLVEQNADVNYRLPSGATALHYMCNGETFSARAVSKLLEFGADPNVPEQHNGATPLHYAADAGDLEVIKVLLRHGADASLVDYTGYDPAGYAKGAGRDDCEQFLRGSRQYSIDIPAAAKAEPDYVARSKQQRQQLQEQRGSRGDDGVQRAALEQELSELQEARATLARLENDRHQIETEQRINKLKLEAEEAAGRIERSEQRAAQAQQEVVALRAQLEAARETADKAAAELRTAQFESTSALASSASTASSATARADELERARARAAAAAEAASERATAAELASALAKTEAEAAKRERSSALKEAEQQAAKARAAETRFEAAAAAAEARREAEHQTLASEARTYADATAERAAALVLAKVEAFATATREREVVAAEAERVVSRQEQEAARAATSAALDDLRASFRGGFERAEAARVAAEEEAARLRRRLEEHEAAAAGDLKAQQNKSAGLEKELKERAVEIAAAQASSSAACGRAERAEARAAGLEQQLVSLAHASTGDQKLQAVEQAAQARVAELERARDDALAGLEREVDRARRAEERASSAADASTVKSALDAHDADAAPRLATLVRESVAAAFEAANARTQRRRGRDDDDDEEELATARADLSRAREALAASDARGAAAESARGDLNREVERLRGELAAARVDEKTAQAQVAAAKEATALATSKSEAAAAERAAQRESLEAARRRYEEDLTAARSTLHRVEEELAAARDENQRLRSESERLLRRFEDEASKRSAREQIEAAAAAAERERKFLTDLTQARRSANAARADAESAAVRVSALAERAASAETRAAAAEAALEATRCERDAANIALRETSDAAETELARARSQVAASKAELASVGALMENVRVLEQRNAQLDRDLTREAHLRKKLHNTIEDMKGKIRVLCRVRPFSSKESANGEHQPAVVKDGQASVTVVPPKGDKKRFTFDHVFEGTTLSNSQAKLFEDVRHLVTSAVDGYNICLFAYGQTGSGKTYTMGSSANIGDSFADGVVTEHAGIAPRTAAAVFEILDERSSQCETDVKLSMFEVYCDKIIDLLNTEKQPPHLKITLAEHSATGLVAVEGSRAVVTTDVQSLVKAMARGIAARTTHATKMNMESSRSHLIMSLEVRTTNRRTGAVVAGKVTLVDLAGSERVARSEVTGDRLKEATAINKSLSALGDVISSLTSGAAAHVPYRNHPLTMLMSDSVGGSAKTMMIVCSSPAMSNVSETVSSLTFATRCKDVTSTSDPRVAAAELSELRTEVARLRRQAKIPTASSPPRGPAVLAARGPGSAGSPSR